MRKEGAAGHVSRSPPQLPHGEGMRREDSSSQVQKALLGAKTGGAPGETPRQWHLAQSPGGQNQGCKPSLALGQSHRDNNMATRPLAGGQAPPCAGLFSAWRYSRPPEPGPLAKLPWLSQRRPWDRAPQTSQLRSAVPFEESPLAVAQPRRQSGDSELLQLQGRCWCRPFPVKWSRN